MNYEQKYKEALEKARQLCAYPTTNPFISDLQDIFPELKESEYEKIRKQIKAFIKSRGSHITQSKTDAWLAWIDKRSEQNLTWSEEDEEYMNNVLYILNQLKDTSSYNDDIAENTINWIKSLKYRLYSNNEYDKDMLGAIEYCIKNNRPFEKEHIAWIDKQVEKLQGKSARYTINDDANKVEPKFHEGDWVIDKDGIVRQILSYKNGVYKHTDGYSAEIFEDNWRLWTIQDAKEGDVLCIYECGEPKIVFILKGIPKKHYALRYYCFYNIMYSYFQDDSKKGCLAPKDEDVKPATKEQRDILFQKMKESGYEWMLTKVTNKL